MGRIDWPPPHDAHAAGGEQPADDHSLAFPVSVLCRHRQWLAHLRYTMTITSGAYYAFIPAFFGITARYPPLLEQTLQETVSYSRDCQWPGFELSRSAIPHPVYSLSTPVFYTLVQSGREAWPEYIWSFGDATRRDRIHFHGINEANASPPFIKYIEATAPPPQPTRAPHALVFPVAENVYCVLACSSAFATLAAHELLEQVHAGGAGSGSWVAPEQKVGARRGHQLPPLAPTPARVPPAAFLLHRRRDNSIRSMGPIWHRSEHGCKHTAPTRRYPRILRVRAQSPTACALARRATNPERTSRIPEWSQSLAASAGKAVELLPHAHAHKRRAAHDSMSRNQRISFRPLPRSVSRNSLRISLRMQISFQGIILGVLGEYTPTSEIRSTLERIGLCAILAEPQHTRAVFMARTARPVVCRVHEVRIHLPATDLYSSLPLSCTSSLPSRPHSTPLEPSPQCEKWH